MSSPHLIVCEKSGRWAVAFRRALGGEARQMIEVRSILSCETMLAQHPTSIIAIEITAANLDTLVAAVPGWLRSFPHCRVLALAEADLASAETLLREAGAVAVLHSTREAPAACRLIERHIVSGIELEQPAIAQRLDHPPRDVGAEHVRACAAHDERRRLDPRERLPHLAVASRLAEDRAQRARRRAPLEAIGRRSE